MRHVAQEFASYAIDHTHCSGKADFKLICRMVLLFGALEDTNIISSHELYGVEVMDDKALNLKAWIAQHGDEESHLSQLCSNCFMCSLVEACILLSTAAPQSGRIAQPDVKAAFLHTGRATKDVYVILPRDIFGCRKALKMLLTATYCLVNASAESQVQSNRALTGVGFVTASVIHQLSLLHREGSLAVILTKIVDTLMVAGSPYQTDQIVAVFNDWLNYGIIFQVSCHIRSFGFLMTQSEDMSTTVDGNNKLWTLEYMPIIHSCCKELDAQLDSVDKTSLAFVKC